MSQIIEVKLNKDGKAIVILYGKEFDVTDQVDEAGFGKLEAFGEVYQFQITKISTVRVGLANKKAKK